MKRIAVTVIVIMACAISGWSQAYYEASGQTDIFTLAPGAKTGHSGTQAAQTLHRVTVSNISITVARSGIIVALPSQLPRGSADISVSNVAGRQIYRQHGFSGRTLRFENGVFKPGIYAIRVCVDGQKYVRRFAITGQGE